ncbi:hypothetical protein [Amycolatopsis sp. NPDC051716]|uniref:hypothetical protein n=1 Tax=Amycolatopsis sp. NPDC051716 TaxID=3155804 RepID=UPI003428E408
MDETQPSLTLTNLTELEHQVINSARCGEIFKPAITMTVDELAVTDDPDLRIRADLLRELLRGLHGHLDPRGIRIVGVRVVGELDLDRIIAGTGLDLNQCALPDVIITGTGEFGPIRLLNARIGGQLELIRITITNTTGTALAADGLRTDSDLLMHDATITGTGELGAIRLAGARIGGQLELDQVTITNTTGPALLADGLRTESHLLMRNATITGTGELGAIRLAGAQIGGQAVLQVSRLDDSSGPLLALQEAQITEVLVFPLAVVCSAGRQGMNRRGCPNSDRTITAQGLTYPMLGEISWRQWLHLLVHHTPAYWPQPFQQLAATERAAGHDNNAREVLITQQDELRRRTPHALGNQLARSRHALWGRLGRYGYRAHRLVTALAVILTLAATLSLLAGHVTTHPGHHAAERVPPAPAKPADPGTPCSPVELVGLGIDRGLPLGTTGIRTHCDLDTTTGWGQTFTATLWALQALLWGLATLAIAAYTGLVRKPT